jgi:hypothetical protein
MKDIKLRFPFKTISLSGSKSFVYSMPISMLKNPILELLEYCGLKVIRPWHTAVKIIRPWHTAVKVTRPWHTAVKIFYS